jgi:hypothetical protein
VLENLEVLSESQRDRLADFLSDLEDGIWEIEEKKFTIPENVKIIIRTRSKLMLESWKYVIQIPLRTLKLVEIPKKERLEDIELKENIGYEKEATRWVLNLGRHGWGLKIPLSTAFQGEESTIVMRHQIEQEYKMVQQQKEVVEYIKHHFWNALLFATSKLSKGNQQENC